MESHFFRRPNKSFVFSGFSQKLNFLGLIYLVGIGNLSLFLGY